MHVRKWMNFFSDVWYVWFKYVEDQYDDSCGILCFFRWNSIDFCSLIHKLLWYLVRQWNNEHIVSHVLQHKIFQKVVEKKEAWQELICKLNIHIGKWFWFCIDEIRKWLFFNGTASNHLSKDQTIISDYLLGCKILWNKLLGIPSWYINKAQDCDRPPRNISRKMK